MYTFNCLALYKTIQATFCSVERERVRERKRIEEQTKRLCGSASERTREGGREGINTSVLKSV